MGDIKGERGRCSGDKCEEGHECGGENDGKGFGGGTLPCQKSTATSESDITMFGGSAHKYNVYISIVVVYLFGFRRKCIRLLRYNLKAILR